MTESDVAPLWNELKLIREGQIQQAALLNQHIQTSAESSVMLHEMKETLDKAVSDTQNLYASLPEDEHGRASPFVHKTHHGKMGSYDRERMGERREVSSWVDKIRDIWIEKFVSAVFIIVLFIFGLGLRDYIQHPVTDAHIMKEVSK